jgi:hypothetical protein
MEHFRQSNTSAKHSFSRPVRPISVGPYETHFSKTRKSMLSSAEKKHAFLVPEVPDVLACFRQGAGGENPA